MRYTRLRLRPSATWDMWWTHYLTGLKRSWLSYLARMPLSRCNPRGCFFNVNTLCCIAVHCLLQPPSGATMLQTSRLEMLVWRIMTASVSICDMCVTLVTGCMSSDMYECNMHLCDCCRAQSDTTWLSYFQGSLLRMQQASCRYPMHAIWHRIIPYQSIRLLHEASFYLQASYSSQLKSLVMYRCSDLAFIL